MYNREHLDLLWSDDLTLQEGLGRYLEQPKLFNLEEGELTHTHTIEQAHQTSSFKVPFLMRAMGFHQPLEI